MPLLTLHDLTIGYRGPPLLDEVTSQIEPGERIGLLGRNGSGKTTLLRIMAGEVEPDHGEAILAPGASVSLLPQDVPRELQGRVEKIVAGGLPPSSVEDQWRLHHRVEQTLSRMELDGDAPFEVLSSGMKRRVLLARAIAAAPELLLLDEPTNHLDLEAIVWLEDFLTRWPGTLVFVTHDRRFLRKLAGRILEIDRGKLFDWSCDYDTFLKRKEAALEAEEKQNALFDKKLAQEEVWIRTGIKARRTRNEGRVRALEAMRRQRTERRSSPGAVRLEIQQAQRSGDLVCEASGISFSYGAAEGVGSLFRPTQQPHGDNDDRKRLPTPSAPPTPSSRPIVRDFSTTILRGDKIGVIGPNGAGKTTLLKLLLGQLPPQSGTVRTGTNLQIAYFDQLREQLDESKSVQENVGEGYDSVGAGAKAQHIIGYLQNFLFTPERARTSVRFLSGGERNRVLLAKLFAKPANVIVLDEPTNDLDAETLELLEARLVEFEGTVLLVSHDREFLNNVVSSTIVFEPEGVREYVGGYDDWLRQRTEPAPAPEKLARAPGVTAAVQSSPPARRRLKFKEQQELAALPGQIEQLESEIAAMHDAMSLADFYRRPGAEIAEAKSKLADLEAQLTAAYHRWEELSDLAE
jgi:ATP-binding cassette subfamily F protein uup